MANLLKQLELDELSLVDRPANAQAMVSLFKRDNSDEEVNKMTDEMKAKVKAYMEENGVSEDEAMKACGADMKKSEEAEVEKAEEAEAEVEKAEEEAEQIDVEALKADVIALKESPDSGLSARSGDSVRTGRHECRSNTRQRLPEITEVADLSVDIELFGIPRLITGVKVLRLDVEKRTTFRDIVRMLGATYPALIGDVIQLDGETLYPPHVLNQNGKRMVQEGQMGESPSDGDQITLMAILAGG